MNPLKTQVMWQFVLSHITF